jgi:hypothetical protein
MLVLFLVCAGLQYNDPDPQVWVPIYLFPAALSVLRMRGRRLLWLPLLGAVACVAAALWWAPPYVPGYLDNEAAREAGGLLLSGLWMAALAVDTSRLGRAAA